MALSTHTRSIAVSSSTVTSAPLNLPSLTTDSSRSFLPTSSSSSFRQKRKRGLTVFSLALPFAYVSMSLSGRLNAHLTPGASGGLQHWDALSAQNLRSARQRSVSEAEGSIDGGNCR